MDKKSYKKQKKDTLNEKPLSIIYKIKKLWKKKQEIIIKTCQKKKRTKSKSIKRKGIKNWFNTKKKALKNKLINLSVCTIIMSEKTLKFNNIKINKKEFHKSKQAIDLDSVNTDKIVVSDKFKHSEEGYKYFIGYQEGDIVKPLCIILPQINGYIKYFENGGKKHVFVN